MFSRTADVGFLLCDLLFHLLCHLLGDMPLNLGLIHIFWDLIF